jgi:hypothetical protein
MSTNISMMSLSLSVPSGMRFISFWPTIRNIDFEYDDIYDGIYFQKEFFQQRQNILLFSIYYDDFEIVNPSIDGF